MTIKRDRLEEIIREEYNKLFTNEGVAGVAGDVAADVASDVADGIGGLPGTQTYLDPLADFEDLDAGFEEMVVTLMDLLDATKETNDVLKDKLNLMIRVMDHNNDTLKDFIDTQDRGQKVSAKKEKVDEATINEVEPVTMAAAASAIGTVMKERALLKEILENIKRILGGEEAKVSGAIQTVIDKIDQFDEKLLAGDEAAQYAQDFIVALSSLGTEGRFALNNIKKELKKTKKKGRGAEQILFRFMLTITQWLALSTLKLISKVPQKGTVMAMKSLLGILKRVGPQLKTIEPIGQEQPENIEDVLKQLDDALGPNVNVKGPGRMTQQEDPPKPKPPEDMFGYIGKGFKENKTMTRTRLQQIIKEEVESVLLEDDGAEDRFKFQWAYQFRTPQNKTTLDKMINDYDALVDYLHARTEPITNEEPKQIADKLFDENSELTFDALIKGLVSRTLVGVPVEALKRIPKSKDAKYVGMALDRIAAKEKRRADLDRELARERTPEEKEAAAIKFGQDMAAGKYGKLD